MSDVQRYESDPLVAEKIRKALEAPVEERKRIELPKPQAVSELDRCRFKPLPPTGKKKIVPR